MSKRLCSCCKKREAGYEASPYDVYCWPCREAARREVGWPIGSQYKVPSAERSE